MSENPRDGVPENPHDGVPENPHDGVPGKTDEGTMTQPYLPGCKPEEPQGMVRAEVYRFGMLLKGMVQRHNITLEEAQTAVTRIFREIGRK